MTMARVEERDVQNFGLEALNESETALNAYDNEGKAGMEDGREEAIRPVVLAILGLGYVMADHADVMEKHRLALIANTAAIRNATGNKDGE